MVKLLSKKNSASAINCIKEGIDFNMNLGNGVFIMFVGGILSKLVGDQQYVFIRDRGWVAI